jgi:hypothetical protein
LPKEPRTAYNAGAIQGGTTLDAVASKADMAVDMRTVSV